MQNKYRKDRLENLLKYYETSEGEEINLKNIKILDSNKFNNITKIIKMNKFSDIAKGINIIAKIDEVETDSIKLEDFNSNIIINKDLYNLELKKKDIIKCKIEYTILTETFNISECEILKLKTEKIIEIFQNSSGGSIFEKLKYILNLMGINSDKLMFREQLFFLTRLIPLVVKNYSLVDFSEKGLGKTKSLEIFSNSYIAKSSESVAELFFNKTNKKLGVLPDYDVLVVDEIQKRKDNILIDNLQKYLEQGELPRTSGKKLYYETSIVLTGNANLDKNKEYQDLFTKPKENIFKNHSIINKEFLDRLNYILPSWGSRPFEKSFSKDTEPDIDFLKLVCEILRKTNIEVDAFITDFLDQNNLSLTDRAYNAIKKTTEGYIKLLNLEEKDYDLAFYLATEGRFLIEDILEIVENKPKNYSFFDEVLRKNTYKVLVSEVLNINENDIVELTPHEVYYYSKFGITVEALDTIGLQEINHIKKYFDKRYVEKINKFTLELNSNDNQIDGEYKNIQDDLESENYLCEYQNNYESYLYGYKLDGSINYDLLRTKRIIFKNKLFCLNKSKDKCQDNLEFEEDILICDECETEYSYKEYSKYLRKL